MKYLLVLVMLVSMGAQAVVTLNSKTHTKTGLTQCADGKWWSKCLPGNVVQGAHLAFSDLITGPDTGLGDGNGSGVIVTVWGYNLGSSQGSSTIQYRDSANTARNGHVYYWKDADGTLPGGPANLYESHGMQEIAFSIPDSAVGAGTIEVTTSEGVTSLPFTVRAGNIYHVASNGNDSNDGSFASPWLTIEKGDSVTTAGDSLYVHDIDTGAYGVKRAIYNNAGFSATEANQMAYVGYPNTRPTVSGHQAVYSYLTTGLVFSKFAVFSSTCADETMTNCVAGGGSDGIVTSEHGRVIGNSVTDIAGGCASGQSGAISGGYGRISNAKVFGNYVYDYGCIGSNDLHHTTYFTIRDNDGDSSHIAPEVAYNYLDNNRPKDGIHFYDENVGSGTECGQFTSTISIHDNVIKDQGSAGIFVDSSCHWTNDVDIANNVLINTGLGSDNGTKMFGSAIVIRRGVDGTITLRNNTIYEWDRENYTDTRQACINVAEDNEALTLIINDNVCYGLEDKPFVYIDKAWMEDNVSGSGNAFYTTAGTQVRAVPPAWDASKITTDPLLTLTGSKISVGDGSPLINQSSTTLTSGLYGAIRGNTSNVGAIQSDQSAPQTAIIFSENFDSQADWTTDQLTIDMYDTPANWTVGRTDPLWSPLGSDPTAGKHPTAEILSANASMAYGGAGKSYVMWRESYDPGWNKFNSEALIMKTIPDTTELYMSVMINISSEMVSSFYADGLGQSKVMRVLHVDPDTIQGDPNNYFSFFGDTNSPKVLFDITGETTYSIRNFLGVYVRGDNDITGEITGVPSGFAILGGGDLSLSYSQGGTNGAQLTDYKHGGIVNTVPVMIDQVFGDESQWVKIAMYVKLNSAPGIADGEIKQWVDGVQISNLGGIPFIQSGQEYRSFNTVAIGGNDFFQLFPNVDKYQEWYAIDDLEVLSQIPEELQ